MGAATTPKAFDLDLPGLPLARRGNGGVAMPVALVAEPELPLAQVVPSVLAFRKRQEEIARAEEARQRELEERRKARQRAAVQRRVYTSD